MEDLQKILETLRAAGVECQSCDEIEWVKVPYYPSGAECGIPRETYDDVHDEYVLLPASMVVAGSTYVIPAVGRSMEGAGIYDGDKLTIMATTTARNGDVVLALVAGRATVKGYFEDAFGRCWLVPHNKNFKPLLVTEETDVRVIGVVKGVLHTEVTMSERYCNSVVMSEGATPETPSPGVAIAKAVREVLPLIRYGRQWYAVYRVLVDKKKVREEDYDGFLKLLGGIVDDDAPSTTVQELQRMAVQSFARRVALWDANDAPVVGKRFFEYQTIAQRFAEALG